MQSEAEGGFEIPSVERTNDLDDLRKRDEAALREREEAALKDQLREIKEESTEEEKVLAHQWERFDAYAEASSRFSENIDRRWELFYENHKDNKRQRDELEEYDQLMDQVRQALVTFLEEMQKAEQKPGSKDYAGAILMEGYIDFISNLCKEIYKIDNTFPDLKLFDKEKFVEAISEEIGKDSEYTGAIKIKEHVGRFVIAAKGSANYILDQQANKITNKDISKVEEPRNGMVVVQMSSGLLGDPENFLFNGETGEFSEGYDYIQPAIGDLWLSRERGSIHDEYLFTILDKSGSVLESGITEYIPSKNKRRALVKGWHAYNVVLEDGSLLFEKSEMMPMQSVRNSVIDGPSIIGRGNENIIDDIILGEEDRFVRLNPNLEIEAEGSSLEEVKKAA